MDRNFERLVLKSWSPIRHVWSTVLKGILHTENQAYNVPFSKKFPPCVICHVQRPVTKLVLKGVWNCDVRVARACDRWVRWCPKKYMLVLCCSLCDMHVLEFTGTATRTTMGAMLVFTHHQVLSNSFVWRNLHKVPLHNENQKNNVQLSKAYHPWSWWNICENVPHGYNVCACVLCVCCVCESEHYNVGVSVCFASPVVSLYRICCVCRVSLQARTTASCAVRRPQAMASPRQMTTMGSRAGLSPWGSPLPWVRGVIPNAYHVDPVSY